MSSLFLFQLLHHQRNGLLLHSAERFACRKGISERQTSPLATKFVLVTTNYRKIYLFLKKFRIFVFSHLFIDIAIEFLFESYMNWILKFFSLSSNRNENCNLQEFSRFCFLFGSRLEKFCKLKKKIRHVLVLKIILDYSVLDK
jgi:hypothetical protein